MRRSSLVHRRDLQEAHFCGTAPFHSIFHTHLRPNQHTTCLVVFKNGVMSTALDRVVNTTELLEMILLALPLNYLLQARQISRTCRDLIDGSKYLQNIRAEPYIGVYVRFPKQCSISEQDAPVLEADFVLYYDKAVTINKALGELLHHSRTFFKFEEGNSPPDFPQAVWGSKWSCRPRQFVAQRAHRWTTLYPGVPYRLSWSFRWVQSRRVNRQLQLLLSMEAGKKYVLRVRPYYRVGHLVGIKELLLARKERGEDLESCVLDKPLRLIGENEVHFTAVP